MIKVPITIELFKIEELGDYEREIAINNHKSFLLSNVTDEDLEIYESFENIKDAYDDTYVLETIEINNYLYYKSGELAYTINYCGAHPRSGEHVLIHEGIEYKIN